MLTKIKTTIFALVIMITSAMAQSPSMINYQGVARDAAGSPIANQNIKVRLKVRNNTSVGAVQYSETRLVTTSANGLFNIQIGSPGTVAKSGSFEAITWGSGPKFLQVEMDPAGGTSFINMGTQQMISVPYAQYSDEAGTLKFPFAATDSLNSVMFSIINKNQNAMYANSTNGIGLYAWSTNSIAVFGENNSSAQSALQGSNYSSGAGVKGSSASGNGVYGSSTSPTVAAIEASNNSGGPGLKSVSSQNNGIIGQTNSGSAYGVYGFNPNGYAVRGYTTSLNAGVFGEAQNNFGGIGVYGRSSEGYGVFGYSVDSTAVFAKSDNATAIEALALNGFALKTSGNIKIAGGNTNPGRGKVLTSDSAGNATWEGAVAFKANGLKTANIIVGANSTETAEFENEVYDLGNNYDPSQNAFTAPVNGIYNFNIQITGGLSVGDDFLVTLLLNRSGSISTVVVGEVLGSAPGATVNSINTDVKAQTGDVFSVLLTQLAGSTLSINTSNPTDTERHWFSGRLVIKL